MKEELTSFETAKLAKEKGFNINVFKYFFDSCNSLIETSFIAGNHNNFGHISIPTQSLLQKWLREEHKIEVTVMPMFRDKCGYDSFKRDGYTFEIVQINPCQHLMWSDFNVCAEDRDEEIKEEGELLSLKPSVETYEKALESGLIEGLKLPTKEQTK